MIDQRLSLRITDLEERELGGYHGDSNNGGFQMVCPNGHGEMELYDSNLTKDHYVCKTCGMKLDKDNVTGHITKGAGLAAAAGAAFLIFMKLFGGGGGHSGST
jgi:hypothetical protein